jgi:hypothetical protein
MGEVLSGFIAQTQPSHLSFGDKPAKISHSVSQRETILVSLDRRLPLQMFARYTAAPGPLNARPDKTRRVGALPFHQQALIPPMH